MAKRELCVRSVAHLTRFLGPLVGLSPASRRVLERVDTLLHDVVRCDKLRKGPRKCLPNGWCKRIYSWLKLARLSLASRRSAENRLYCTVYIISLRVYEALALRNPFLISSPI